VAFEALQVSCSGRPYTWVVVEAPKETADAGALGATTVPVLCGSRTDLMVTAPVEL